MNNPKNSTFVPAGIFVGQTVYLEPLGNNVRYWDGVLKKAQVKAVKRKYIYCEREYGQEIRIEIETGETPHDGAFCNAGWRLWLAEEDYGEHAAAKAKLRSISTFFGCWTNHKRVSVQDVNAIFDILEKYMEEDAKC